MDIDALRLFIDVANSRSFSAAARRRGLDPSSVSRLIARIEAELGARLFQRTTRQLVPTEAGARYLARVAPLIEELDRAGEEIASSGADPAGTLRLTASVAFGETCIVPLLPLFRDRFPRLRLELLFTDANLDLVAERIDIAIRLAPGYGADVIGVRLFPTRYRVVASPAYLNAAGGVAKPEKLSGRSCLLFNLPGFGERWLFRHDGAVSEVPVSGDILMSNALGLRQATLAGLGPSLLPDWLIRRDLDAGALIDLFPAADVAATTFDTAAWLLYPSRGYMPRKLRLTIDFLRANLQAEVYPNLIP